MTSELRTLNLFCRIVLEDDANCSCFPCAGDVKRFNSILEGQKAHLKLTQKDNFTNKNSVFWSTKLPEKSISMPKKLIGEN